MLNNLIRLLIVCTIFLSISHSQNRENLPGVSLDGSSGLLLNPSPQTLNVGHVRLGTSRLISTIDQSFGTTMPLAVSLGITGRTELFYSTNTWEINNLEKEKNATLGIRIKVLNLGNSQTSIDFRWQNIELFTANQLSWVKKRIISRAITDFSIFNLKTYANIGYISSLESVDSRFDNHFIGGIGILFPVIKQLNGIIDFQINERESIGIELVGSIGVKWFLFKHVQIASGFNSTIQSDNRTTGVFLNLSFSSEMLTGPRRRVRTKQGLPIPPKLPKEYFTTIDVKDSTMDFFTEQKLDTQISLDNYVRNFIGKEYLEDLPLTPPLDQLEQWLNDVYIRLDNKIISDSEIMKQELPKPPSLDKIGIPWEQKSVKQKKVKDDIVLDNTIISLPKPPPLESLNSKKHR